MQSSVLTDDMFRQRYTTAVEAFYGIAGSYLVLGRVHDAQRLLRTALQLTQEAGEIEPRDRLKLLLLYARVLIVDQLLALRADGSMLAVILNAKQLAEALHDQKGTAEALSLLGQTRYFATIGAALQSGASVDSSQEEGKYDEALAYQQQALALREALHDTQGICESHFCIGNVYERWRQPEQAQEHYMRARQVAEQYGHLFIQSELARHRAIPALFKGDLDQALTLASQALSFREAAPFRPYLPLDHLLLRDIYQAKGDAEQAQRHTEIASSLAEEMGYPALVSSVPNMRDLVRERHEEVS